MDINVNINDEVKVKLTEFGIKTMQENRNKLFGLQNGDSPIGKFNVDIDEEGYTKFQLWDLMQEFGHVMIMGFNEIPFETDIKVIIRGGLIHG